MKKRMLALLLMLALVLSMFAACGTKEEPKKEEAEEHELAKGFYAVLDEDGEAVAYLKSTGKKLTVYDKDGNELMAQAKFSWDDEKEAFVIDDTAAFTVEESKKETSFSVPKKSPTGLDKGNYTLDPIEEDELPTPADKPEPTPDPDPVPDPEPDPIEEPPYVKLPNGYYAIYVGDEPAGYLEFDGDWMNIYDEDGEVTPVYVTWNETTYTYDDDDGEALAVSEIGGAFSMKDLNGTDDFFFELRRIEKLPDFTPAAVDSPFVQLPIGVYGAYYDDTLGGYLEYDGYYFTFYDTDGEADSTFVSWDETTHTYPDDDDENLAFTENGGAFSMFDANDPDGLSIVLRPMDKLPDFGGGDEPAPTPAGTFAGPEKPDSTYDFIQLMEFKGFQVWDYIPDTFIDSWSNVTYTASDSNAILTAWAFDENYNVGYVNFYLYDSFGLDQAAIEKQLTDQYEVLAADDPTYVYDSITEDGGIQCVVISDYDCYFRWYDIYEDGSYQTYLSMLMDNGEICFTALLLATAANEDDYSAMSDLLTEFVSYVEFDKA